MLVQCSIDFEILVRREWKLVEASLLRSAFVGRSCPRYRVCTWPYDARTCGTHALETDGMSQALALSGQCNSPIFDSDVPLSMNGSSVFHALRRNGHVSVHRCIRCHRRNHRDSHPNAVRASHRWERSGPRDANDLERRTGVWSRRSRLFRTQLRLYSLAYTTLVDWESQTPREFWFYQR